MFRQLFASKVIVSGTVTNTYGLQFALDNGKTFDELHKRTKLLMILILNSHSSNFI